MRDIMLGRGGREERSWLFLLVRRNFLVGAGLGDRECCRLGEGVSVMERERVVTGIPSCAIKGLFVQYLAKIEHERTYILFLVMSDCRKG